MFEVRKEFELDDAEREALFGWRDDIFGVARLGIRWRPRDLSFVGREEGRPVSHVGLVRHELKLPSEPVLLGGVAAVLTVPDVRGKGYASRTLEAACAFLRDEWRCDAGMLFCFPRLVPFYERLGWRVLPNRVLVHQVGGSGPVPEEHVMVLPFRKIAWPEGDIRLGSPPW